MSLLDVRRERRELGHRYKRPPTLARLLAYLLMVAGAIWWLSQF